MNIDDFEAPDAPETLKETLDMIFARQRDLMDKYKEIEQLPDPPLSLHHHSGQRIIRDFAWRTVEELTESYEAFKEFLEYQDEVHRHHQIEELADALHFIVELLIFAGVTSTQCFNAVEDLSVHEVGAPDTMYWDATYELGIAMNFLRNKAWKKSHVPTDEGRFREAILRAFKAHYRIWFAFSGGDHDLMFNYYFKKSEVNKFRQRSEY